MGLVATQPLLGGGGDPNALQTGDKISTSPQVGLVATYPLPSVAVGGGGGRGFPNASQRGDKLVVAHKWAGRLHNPCHHGGPQRFTAVNKIRSGPQGA